MKYRYAIALTAALVVAGSAAAGDGPKVSGETMDGTWKIVSLEINKSAVQIDDTLKEIRRIVVGDTHTITLNDNRMVLAAKIDATRDSKTLDMTIVEGDGKGRTYHAIYKLEGDTLTICRHTDPDRARPTGLFTDADSDLFLIVWKRIKP